MIETISLCPVCYKKIPAFIYPKDKQAWMKKECDVHGKFKAMVERSWNHWSNFYRYGSIGINNYIIVHISDKCNMKCPWCYYGQGEEKIHDMDFFHQLLYEPYRGYGLMFSGGEPTIRDDYFDVVKQAHLMGWRPSTITNMINLAYDDFFKKTLNDEFITSNNTYNFALSFQHPKNYSDVEYQAKLKALDNIGKAGLKAACVMFSIQTLDELDYIKDFYDKTRQLYSMLRIRTMFCNWNNKSEKKLFQSDLHEAFMDKFAEYTPVQCSLIEQSTAYGMYLWTREMRHISLMSGPTVENIDYHLCSRPVYMLGRDYRCYPVAIAQIINEGISKGWKDGFQIKEV